MYVWKGIFRPMLFLYLIVHLGFDVSAQALKQQLRILDTDTKAPVAYAGVRVASLNAKTHKSYLANAKGLVSMPLQKVAVISIQAVGYQPYQDTIHPQAQKLTIYIKPDMLHLHELVVTATRTDKTLKDAPVITRVVTAKEVENKGIDNIQTLLEGAVPGLEFQRHGTSNDLDVQGLGGRNILVLVDGERLAGETRGNIDYERINTADIQQVEIVKGASSALYGSQAMGAVVNIITKKPKQKIYAEISAQLKNRTERNFTDIASNDPHADLKRNLDKHNGEYNMLLGFNLKSWQAKTVLNWKNTDGYMLYDTDSLVKHYVNYDTVVREALDTKGVGIEGSKQWSLNQQVSYQWDKYLKAEANVKYYNRHKYDFYKEDKKHDYFDDIGYSLKLHYTRLKNTTLDLSFASDIYNKYDYKERLRRADLNYKDKFITPKAILTYQWRQHECLVGAEYLKETLLTDMFVYGQLINKSTETYTVFMQDDFKWNDRLSLIAGLRGQYNTAFRFQVTPKLSLMYALQAWRLRANYAMGYRAPGLKELYMNWNHLDMFMIEGNPNLRPETNHYTSLSAEYTKNSFNASFTVFHNRFKDKIGGVWAENQSIYRYDNINRSNLYGCDVSVKKQLGHFVLSGAYAYVRQQREDEGLRLSAISPHTANAHIGYALNKPNYRLNVNIGGRYIGAKDFYVEDELMVGNDTISAYYPVHYKGYAVYRLAVHQQFFNTLSLIMGIENLFDYKAPMVTFNSFTGPGRLFFVKLNVKMKR